MQAVDPAQLLSITNTPARPRCTAIQLRKHPGFAARVGVDSAEGADQLTRQAAHIEVPKSDLRKSAG